MTQPVSDVDASNPAPMRGEPPLRVLAVVTVALFMASLGLSTLIGDGTFPSPDESTATIVGYFTENGTAVNTAALLQFAAAVPLAVYASAVAARLRRLGAPNPGVTIAHTGGVLAAAFMSLSAMFQWTLARESTTTNDAVTRAVHDLSFMTGGPGHVVFLGLLVAGIAIPSLLMHLTPRPVAIAGIVIAVVAEFSTLTLATFGFTFLVPIARFPALIWLIVVAFTLPRTRSNAVVDR